MPRTIFFAGLVVAADEHGRLAALELRIHHARIADGIERFDEADVAELALQPLHQGLVEIGEEPQDAVGRWGVRNGIGRVDDGLSRQIRGAGGTQRVGRRGAFDRQDDQLGEFGRLRKATDTGLGILRRPIRELGRRARAEHDLVAMLEKTAGQRLRHVTRSQNSDFHIDLLAQCHSYPQRPDTTNRNSCPIICITPLVGTECETYGEAAHRQG